MWTSLVGRKIHWSRGAKLNFSERRTGHWPVDRRASPPLSIYHGFTENSAMMWEYEYEHVFCIKFDKHFQHLTIFMFHLLRSKIYNNWTYLYLFLLSNNIQRYVLSSITNENVANFKTEYKIWIPWPRISMCRSFQYFLNTFDKLMTACHHSMNN